MVSFFILINNNSEACTIFYSNDGKNVFAGNNEDFLNDRDPEVWFCPSSKGEYGYAQWGFKYSIFKAKWIPQGGMNEKGLFMDGTAVVETENLKEKGKKNTGRFFFNSILKKCATVDDVISLLENYNIKHLEKGQIFIVDKTGDFAIIDNNKITRRSSENYKVVTNFRASNPSLGGYPCKRFSKATKLLNQNNIASIDNFENILNSVHQSDKMYSTIYSTIGDLKNGELYIYNFHNYEKSYKINLSDELKKGKHRFYLKDLFPERISPLLIEKYNNSGFEVAYKTLLELKGNSDYSISISELDFFAQNLKRDKKLDEALKVYDFMQKQYPKSSRPFEMKGLINLTNNNFNVAIENFQKAIEINPNCEFATHVIQQLNSPLKEANTKFSLKGFDDANCVTIIMNTDGWEDFMHFMYKDGKQWTYNINLEKGKYEYIFRVDGKYVLDPSNNNYKEYSSSKVNILEIP